MTGEEAVSGAHLNINTSVVTGDDGLTHIRAKGIFNTDDRHQGHIVRKSILPHSIQQNVETTVWVLRFERLSSKYEPGSREGGVASIYETRNKIYLTRKSIRQYLHVETTGNKYQNIG